MRQILLRLPVLFALALLVAALPSGMADEGDPAPTAPEPPGGAPGAEAPAEEEPPPDDRADDKVPFVEEVNRALDQGTLWLLGRPTFFVTNKTPMAWWGFIKGERIYGGGEGPTYGHPAGPTALALYTLLKCGVDPKHPTIVEGFNWLKTPHPITKEYDHWDAAGYSWSHRDKQVPGSYEVSAIILALTAKYDTYKRSKNMQAKRKKGKLKISDPDDLEWVQTMVNALVERRGKPLASAPKDAKDKGKGGKSTGKEKGWRYNVPELSLSRSVGKGKQTLRREIRIPPHANEDLSSTQLATLAFFSAHQFGVKVSRDIWLDIVEFTLAHQEAEGPEHERFDPGYKPDRYAPTKQMDHARGFMYIPGSPDSSEGKATGSMTACGVANLIMARDVLFRDKHGDKEWVERGYDKKVDVAIWDGIAWLDLHWSPFTNHASTYGYHIYYLYALERAMDLLGKNLVGEHLWYTEGAKEVLSRQQKAMVKVRLEKNREVDGVFWKTDATHDPKDVLDTCFALLFLKRATKDMIPPPSVTGDGSAPSDNR